MRGDLQESLIPIAPREVLGPQVLVRILDALLKRRKMSLVLPVLIVEVIGIDARDEQGRDTDVDRKLAPELYRRNSH